MNLSYAIGSDKMRSGWPMKNINGQIMSESILAAMRRLSDSDYFLQSI